MLFSFVFVNAYAQLGPAYEIKLENLKLENLVIHAIASVQRDAITVYPRRRCLNVCLSFFKKRKISH